LLGDVDLPSVAAEYGHTNLAHCPLRCAAVAGASTVSPSELKIVGAMAYRASVRVISVQSV
jgi:hypothetical protein